jgi:hypothetical protein
MAFWFDRAVLVLTAAALTVSRSAEEAVPDNVIFGLGLIIGSFDDDRASGFTIAQLLRFFPPIWQESQRQASLRTPAVIRGAGLEVTGDDWPDAGLRRFWLRASDDDRRPKPTRRAIRWIWHESQKRTHMPTERLLPRRSAGRRGGVALLAAAETPLWLAQQAGDLSDLDQVPVRVADVSTDLTAVILRFGEKGGAAS